MPLDLVFFIPEICALEVVQHAFSDSERDRGYLVPDDVYESFDQKKNGRFRLDDFIALCIFVQSARNMFNSFDTSKQGRLPIVEYDANFSTTGEDKHMLLIGQMACVIDLSVILDIRF
ncbi:hypothetical protein TEA_026245 [Camellia sinensis var. sinensis]|uniref:EF-hand domain-containing protein n=1 Tax=Camellia sinensis var. sinensis TaxID=542762 RepID=A0A4S4DJH9_CAMSN|nr:hypothetical protein TEA_026245 [Camellia sinensis var. sinensis]